MLEWRHPETHESTGASSGESPPDPARPTPSLTHSTAHASTTNHLGRSAWGRRRHPPLGAVQHSPPPPRSVRLLSSAHPVMPPETPPPCTGHSRAGSPPCGATRRRRHPSPLATPSTIGAPLRRGSPQALARPLVLRRLAGEGGTS